MSWTAWRSFTRPIGLRRAKSLPSHHNSADSIASGPYSDPIFSSDDDDMEFFTPKGKSQQNFRVSTYSSDEDLSFLFAVKKAKRQGKESTKPKVLALDPKDWKQISVKHRKMFERLLNVWNEDTESMTIINKNGVCFKKEFLIGLGSCGTEVYICLGLDGVERAIKRLPMRQCEKLLKNERDILTSPNAVESPRIVNYWFYDDTTNPDFCYLILNLFECNLEEYVSEKGDLITSLRAREMICQLFEGLKALHAREPRILHRDLKPTNILIDVNGDLVLSDFGVGRFLPKQGETYRTSTESGSMGWLAYECVDWGLKLSDDASNSSKLRWKEKSDIQVAGMLAFYILTKGGHPFGRGISGMVKLQDNNPVGLDHLEDEVAKDLLSQMLDISLDKRPYVEQALKHPYFLSAKELMKLLEAVGNQREVKMVEDSCDIVKLLDNLDPSRPRSPLLPTDWKVVIHPDDLDNFCEGGRSPSRLDGSRYTHCLRLMRNVLQHWHDNPRPALKDMRLATCLEEYFLQCFPTLPLVLHQIIRDRPDWTTRESLKEFFPVTNRRAVSDAEALAKYQSEMKSMVDVKTESQASSASHAIFYV